MSPDPAFPADRSTQLSLPGSTVGRGMPAALRRVLYYLLAGAISSAIGVALVFLPDKLVFAAVVAISSVILILIHPFSGLILYAATVFLRPAEIWPAIGPLHIERIIGVLTLASIALNDRFRQGHLTMDWSRQTRWLLLFWVSTLLSMPFSFWPTQTVSMAIELLKLISFYVMIVTLVNSRKRLALFLWSYLGMIVYFAVTALRDYYGGNFKFAQGIERAVGETSSSGDPNALGGTLACAIILLIMIARIEKNPWKKRILAGALAPCVWALSLTGSRSSLLSLCSGLIFLWWTSRNRVRNGSILLVLAVFAYFALPEQYKERYQSIGNTQIDESSMGRLDAWMAGAQMFVDYPVCGIGIGCFTVAHATKYHPGHWINAHNLYVQVPAEIGVLGAITFFGFLFHSLKTLRSTSGILGRSKERHLELACLHAMITGYIMLSVFSCFGHTMLRPTWYVYAALGQAIHRMSNRTSISDLAG